MLESTTYPLELYFEHRNYVPVIGPVFALVFAVVSVKGTYMKYARGALLLYVLVNSGVLVGITTLWGKPLQAATYWHVQQPDSVRAATTLAKHQLTDMGPKIAMVTLQQFAARHPQHAYIRIPELTLACTVSPQRDHSAIVDRLKVHLPSVAFSYTAGTMLDQLLTTVSQGDCESVGISDVVALASAMLSGPSFGGNPDYRQFHHKLMARVARLTGDTEATLEHLAQAIDYRSDNELNMMMVTTLVADSRFDEAHEFIESAQYRLPRQPLRRYNGRNQLQQLSAYVNEAERLTQAGNEPDFDDSTGSN